MSQHTYNLLCDYLRALQVPYTDQYTRQRYDSMPFRTMFGLTKLLQEYGVDSEGYQLADTGEIAKLTPPFIAKTAGGFVIVTDINPESITYRTEGVSESMALAEFLPAWCGRVILSFPKPQAQEPDYRFHARIEFFTRAKKWVLAVCALILFAYAFISHGFYRSPSVSWLAVIDLIGLYLTYLLVQKSANINNAAADRFCGVLEAHGCDRILEMKASKFFGLFGWSEVGFAYFSVSLMALLIFPSSIPMLALCNLCCLPFTLWSIWYQRFRAHRWCTLCVCVQASLWLLFFGYLGGGWLQMAWPPNVGFVLLGLAYLGVMLALNALMPLIENQKTD